jgi:hypothetical protein
LEGSLAFAPTADQYLLVYSSNEIDSGPNIYARVLGSDGSPQGKDFRLSTVTGEMSKPVVAYSPQAQRFLVAWSRKLYDVGRDEIVGVSVGLDGKIASEEFWLSLAPISNFNDQRTAIAYCPGRDRFLVTWSRGNEYSFDEGVADIYGQFVSGDGTRVQGGNFVIAAAAKNQFKQDAACDGVNDRFLVVWEDQRNLSTHDDIYGQLIASDGTMIGQNFLVAGTRNVERRPVVAANKDGTYLVVWESVVEGSSGLVSETLDAEGRLLRGPTPIGSDQGGTRNRAAVAYLKQQDVFLVVWDNSGFEGTPDGIWGQFVQSNGTLRETAFPLTTAKLGQYRPHVAAARNTFLAVWTDYRDTGDKDSRRHVYEYYGRVIGNDMALSSRWKNPESK